MMVMIGTQYPGEEEYQYQLACELMVLFSSLQKIIIAFFIIIMTEQLQ